jgi:O-antigen ligase
MSKIFNRRTFIPFWLLTCVLLAALSSPMSGMAGLLLLIVGTVVPIAAIFLWKVPPPTIAEVLNRVERSTTHF